MPSGMGLGRQRKSNGCSECFDHAAEILSWGPVADLGAHRLHVWLQVWRVVFMVGTKARFDGKLERDAARERDR